LRHAGDRIGASAQLALARGTLERELPADHPSRRLAASVSERLNE
jgi:hypothetical protein